MKHWTALAAAGFIAAAAFVPANAADISGAGATFPYPIYAKWADAYKKETGVGIAYQPVGSSEGIRQIHDKEVTFGASDMPLNAADLDAHGLVQFPTVVGGIVAVVNIEGIKSGDITLDGPTLARILSARSGHGTTPRCASSIRGRSCRRSRSWWCAAPTAPARPLCLRTTSPR